MQLRFLICIPTYNHTETVGTVINDCLSLTSFSILVVDDGSTENVENLYLQQNNQLSEPVRNRLNFVRHPQNLGKGVALKTSIDWAIKNEFTHLITIDSDGQHPVKEVKKLVQSAYENPWSVVIGDRQMLTQNVPSSSKFGKAFSNFWVKYQTEQNVGDSQSGFRIYPLFYLQNIRFISKRYDFEVEILTRLIWKGVTVKSVSVEVIYLPPGERITHFNKFKDNLRLTILNTLLVCASLLRRNDPPLKSAFATGLGVFIGCFPIYGLHTLIVAVISFVFRMNFIYLWLGTQISIPPLVPFLFIATGKITKLFDLKDNWFLGLLILASILSIIFAFIVFLIKNNNQKLTINKSQKISVKSNDGFGISFMKMVLKKFGLKPTYFFLYFIIPYYYLFSSRTRKSANEYWKMIHPSKGYFSRQKFILSQLLVFAKILVDRGFQKNFSDNKFQLIEDPQLNKFFDVLSTMKKGHISVMSHIGGWELAMNYFQRKSNNNKMTAVMFNHKDSFQHSSLNSSDKNIEMLHFNQAEGTLFKLKESLLNNNSIGLMIDRPVGRSYELIPFFGKLALFDSTPFRLMLLTESELSYIFCFKVSIDKYSIKCTPVDKNYFLTNAKSREEVLINLMKDYAKSLETMMLQYPEQWFNFFPFWSEKIF